MRAAKGGAFTPERLMRIATFYLARQSASAAKLRDVLARRIARGAPDQDGEPMDEAAIGRLVDPVIDRLLRTGLLDDAAFARGRAASLAAKGRPAWRIRTELALAGVDAEEAGLADTLAELDPLEQAFVWARRHRAGPFRTRDRLANRDRDIARLARAGFAPSIARQVVDREDDGTDAVTGAP